MSAVAAPQSSLLPSSRRNPSPRGAAILIGLIGMLALAGCVSSGGITSAPVPANTPGSGSARSLRFHEQPVEIPGHGLTLSGVLFTPEHPGPRVARRPAVVLLHGCGGMFGTGDNLAARHRDWAERFVSWGHVTLLLDSFTPRGLRSLCELQNRPIHPWRERNDDAYAALDFLAARGDVDATRVLVLGWSHGGSTVMGLVRAGASGRAAGKPSFKAAVAFYPGCSAPLAQRQFAPAIPLLILHGEADDWTPVAPCIELGKRLQNHRPSVRVVTYPGAHHGFDQPGTRPPTFRADVYNPLSRDGRGAHVGPNPQAREAAIHEVKNFIGERAVNGAIRQGSKVAILDRLQP